MKSLVFVKEQLNRISILIISLSVSMGIGFYFFYKHVKIKKDVQPCKVNQYALNYFIDYLFRIEGFSYTLLGNKPMSMTEIYDLSAVSSHDVYSFTNRFLDYNVLLYRGLNYFLSIQKQFSSKNYPFFLCRNQSPLRSFIIIIVNKQAFCRAFEENYELFYKYLGNIKPESLIDKIKNTNVYEALDYREDLLGILLGYGCENAKRFQQRHEILMQIQASKAIENKVKEELIIEYQRLTSKLEFCNGGRMPSDVRVLWWPYFSADLSSQDTKHLIDQYDKETKEISSLFREKNCVKVILEKLNSS